MQDWILGGILALFIIIPSWLALARRREVQRQVEAWPELAQRTGLTYGPGHLISGEYRGCLLRQVLDSEVIGPPWTLISLNVENSAGFSFSVYGYQIAEISSGHVGFDSRFNRMGSPREYVQAAVAIIIREYPPLRAWMMRNFCSIELKGGNLMWSQNSELTDVDDQIALLNLLCDLAELAEQMRALAVPNITAGTRKDD